MTAGGRPWKERRAVLNGISWVLRTGAPWVELPDRYPSYQTCHRRFQQWVQSGVMRGILEALAAELKIHGLIDVKEAFIDGSFAPSKKGAPRSGKQSEVTNTLVQMVIPDAPQNLVGDNAYDSDKLDSELRRYGIELIAPTPHESKKYDPGPASPVTVSPTLDD